MVVVLQQHIELGDLEHASNCRLRAGDAQRTTDLAGLAVGHHQRRQSSRVHEVDLRQVDDQARLAEADVAEQVVLQGWCGGQVDLTAHLDDETTIDSTSTQTEPAAHCRPPRPGRELNELTAGAHLDPGKVTAQGDSHRSDGCCPTTGYDYRGRVRCVKWRRTTDQVRAAPADSTISWAMTRSFTFRCWDAFFRVARACSGGHPWCAMTMPMA